MNADAAVKAKIRVLVVDDSALMRHVLKEILNSAPDIEVIGAAADPFEARDKIKRLNPDVLTLDVEMPKMDGVQFLRNIMRLRPMPVVMISSLTTKGAGVTLEALDLGAVDFVSKPEIDIEKKLHDYSEEIIDKVRAASQVQVQRICDRRLAAIKSSSVINSTDLKFTTTDQILAIGASTGGTEAIREVLERLPENTPGTVIVQHIPGMFSGPFAERLNKSCKMTVTEAKDGERVLQGHAYIAPGDKHLRLIRDGARYYCKLDDSEPVNRHKPSVDVLFDSVAKYVGKNAIGVMLTGMGKDGAVGMKAMLDAGAKTIAQDEQSSVVWGMPGAAFQIGAVEELAPLEDIAARIVARASEKKSKE